MAPAFDIAPPGSFEICADPAFQADAVAELSEVAGCAREALAAFEPLGLILAGSLARGEGTVVARRDGTASWLSDIECIAVFPDATRDFRTIDAALRALEASFNSDPGRASRGVHLEVRAITAAKFSRMREAIFSREMLANGKLLWGVPERIAAPRWASAPPAIPPIDALRLLVNRVAERLELRLAAEARALAPDALAYRNAKFWIDLATSLSVFLGCYLPGYRARETALVKRLGRAPRILDAAASELLLGHLRDAMEVKLGAGPRDGSGLSASLDAGAQAGAWALRWETDRMLGGDAGGDGWDWIPRRLRRVESRRQRARDWGRLWLRTGRGACFAAPWPAVMLGYGSPTAAIYSAACLLDFFWNDAGTGKPPADALVQSLARLFGVKPAAPAATRSKLAEAALRAWTAHVRFNAA